MAVITGDNNQNNLVYSEADEQITGLDGNDFVDAGEGDDRIIFGAALTANDTLVGGLGNDTLVLGGKSVSNGSLKMVELTSSTSWNDNFSQMGTQVSRANFQLTNAGIFHGAIDVPGGVTVSTVLGWDIDTLMLSNRRSYNGLQADTYWANGVFQTLKSRPDQDVFAYVNVGKVDKNLDNYEIAGASDPWFGGTTSVANINFANFWDASWFTKIKTEVDHAIRSGADGIVVNEIDVYSELRDVAGRTLRDNARDMMKLVSDLAVYARQASNGGSEFRIMVNGAASILDHSVSFSEGGNQSNATIASAFVASVDAMIFENPFDGQIAQTNTLNHLRQQYGSGGKQVVIVDSMKNVGLQDVDSPEALFGLARQFGFIPFHANAGTAGGPVLDYLTAPRISGPNSNRPSGSNDELTGTPIADVIDGGAGNDTISGQAGNDTLLGGTNNDQLAGGAGNDSLDGGAGNDSLNGHDGADTLLGGQGDDVLDGSDGDDILFGGLGDDRLFGVSGDDTLDGGGGADFLSGGNFGYDFASYQNSVSGLIIYMNGGAASTGEANGDQHVFIDGIIGSQFADIIGGDENGNELRGLNGNDWLFGVSGVDTLQGGGGNDILSGGLGGDILDGGIGIDVAYYREASSSVTGSLATGGTSGEAFGDTFFSVENIWGSVHNDNLLGDNNAGQVYGFEGDDTLSGLGGDDFFYGGSGIDNVTGGEGVDSFFLLAWRDQVNEFGTIERAEGGDNYSDFNSGTDRIIVSRYWFGFGNIAGPAAALTAANADFVINDQAIADRPTFLWSSTNRTLSFDADGMGAGATVLLGTFQTGATVVLSDIWTA